MSENATNNDWLHSVADRPLLVSDAHVNTFLAGANLVASFLAGNAHPADEEDELRQSTADGDDFWSGWIAKYYRPYNVSDGILTIPVHGSLLDKVGVQFGAWATGYTYIQKAFERGMEDAAVGSILLEVDSPGGDGAGNFELVEYMREVGGHKPVHAVANGLALSGGYSIASVADTLTVRPSGATGSVGVISVHMDVSEMLANEGIKPTIIRSGKYKAEGNMLEPLSAHARDNFQESSDRLYDTFVKTVARNRGISEDSVRETEARVYGADDSMAVGFADRIGEVRHQRARMLEPRSEGMQMADEATQPETTTTVVNNTVSAPADAASDHPTISDPDTQAQINAAVADAIRADRQRTAAVMGCDEYAGREKLATQLLAETDLAAEAIEGLLKAAPKASADGGTNNGGGQARNHFNETMDREGGAGATGGEPAADTADHPLWPGRSEGTISILDSYRSAGGRVNDDSKRMKPHG